MAHGLGQHRLSMPLTTWLTVISRSISGRWSRSTPLWPALVDAMLLSENKRSEPFGLARGLIARNGHAQSRAGAPGAALAQEASS